MSGTYYEQTGQRRDRTRSHDSKQRTLQRRVIRYEKYGVDFRRVK